MIEPSHPQLSTRRQCELVALNRRTFYDIPAQESNLNLHLMRLIDEQCTRAPFYGWPRMSAHLFRQRYGINHKRVQRLMRTMGLQAIYPKRRTTIAENIGYAKPGSSAEEIMQAAKIANAHDFIVQFTDGYDTLVGERGQRLSGGERQRVSIARAVLRDPRILILDEATSLVDTETEKKIQEALARLVKDRTTFAIAHRLSTLRNANRLMVLEKGKRVEMGTHDELMEKKGVYHKLVELQRELSQIKAVDG